MKKMKFIDCGEVFVWDMTYDNMHEVLAFHYDYEVASERVWSEGFGEWIAQGMRYYWVDGERVPADYEAMEWAIEEALDLETGDFEEESQEEYSKPYYDAQLMQYMI
ncbi:hypothetical protein ACF3NG_06945 [Aerococcaceae bacterium WGS1372]